MYVVHVSPNDMAPEYAIERRGLGDDIELRSWRATDNEALGLMSGTLRPS